MNEINWPKKYLPSNRLRIFTQKSQIGKPAATMVGTNMMIGSHLSWTFGLMKSAKEKMTL